MADIPELAIGSTAPAFKLPASTGVDVSLADFQGKSNVYLFFVREYN